MKKWLAVGVWMMVIFIASAKPMDQDIGAILPNVGHFFEYAVLGILSLRAIIPTWKLGFLAASILAISLATSYGIAMEIVQIAIPTRFFSVEDMIMNFAGATVALVLLRLSGLQDRI